MFPFRDHNPSRKTPYVTWALIAINIAVFIYMVPIYDNDRALISFYTTWGLVPVQASASDYVTSQFVHGGLLHIAGNMLFLWIYGDNIEDELGHTLFLGFYLFGGMVAGAAQVIADPSSPVPMVGASGAVAAVMGGYLLMFPRARIDVLFIFIVILRIYPIPAWLVLGLWFVFQLVSGVITPSDAGGVAYWAHAGGFVAGILLILPLWRRRGGVHFWARSGGAPNNPVTDYSKTRIPLTRSHIPPSGGRRR